MFKLKGAELKFLIFCGAISTHDNKAIENCIYNNTLFKDLCRENGLNMNNASIDNTFSLLTKKGFLLKVCRGEYILNPLYFYKGSLSNRASLISNLKKEQAE